MKPLDGYANAQAYTDTERLPVGGYVLKILNVEFQDNSSKDYNDAIVISFDIAEGEHKDFFANNYRAQVSEDKKWKGNYRIRVPKDDGSEQDNWAMRRFKTIINAFEESNRGYHWDWDEQKLKGKTIGAVFNNKEYEFNGRTGFFTNCHSLISAERIRENKFKIPADTLLNRDGAGRTDAGSDRGWMNIPDDINDDALPFN